ncbi:MAG: signal peptidase I, partial [Aeromicrobium sp.]
SPRAAATPHHRPHHHHREIRGDQMSTRRAQRSSLRGWTTQVIAWFVTLAVLLVLAVSVLVPRIGGATPYTILTSSMEPGMPPGTLVVVKPVDADDIAIGDVVTYQLESGEATVVTHRVVAQGYDLTGKLTFTTQGDANSIPDAEPVRPVQIRGEQWYAVPYLGRVTNVLNNNQRETAVVVAVVVLFGYAATMFAGSTRDRRSAPGRRRQEVAS